MPRKESNTGPISAQAQQDLVSEGIENFELPKSVVARIAKSAIPESAKLQKETVLSLVKGSTVFINYLAAMLGLSRYLTIGRSDMFFLHHSAHDVALSKQHKSISASDVLKALEMIEFGDMVEMLQSELQIYREYAKTDKSKKGSSNINSTSISSGPSPSKARPKDVASASSASAKAKGKEKEKSTALPPPFTSIPLTASAGPPYEFGSTGVRPEGATEDEEMVEEVEGDEFVEDYEGQELAEDDEGEGDVDMGEDEEEEEIRRDAQGLEEPPLPDHD